MHEAAILTASAFCLLLVDAWARSGPVFVFRTRSAAGAAVLVLAGLCCLGLALALTGSWAVSAVFAVMLAGALSLVSNTKRVVLGEPLIFTDFALIGALFQHPQFYFSALRPWQVGVLVAGIATLVAALVFLSVPHLMPRLAGLGLAALAVCGVIALLNLAVWETVVNDPDPERDVARHGLVPTLLAHWWRWRKLADPPPCTLPQLGSTANELVIIVQCESFADPAQLFDDPSLALPGLSAARSCAFLSGQLNVSGFGAYTMRTEYGVLFGRHEGELGLRQFDPFLTAQGEASYAMPNRLNKNDWVSHFVHPHDMRFYGRGELMPLAGFSHVVGQEAFASPKPEEGRYVTDAAIADKILAIAGEARRSTLIYAVTIENHGPWPAASGDANNGEAYLRLLRNSDRMLARLLAGTASLSRPVTLCFFGDHRPSIPSLSEPGPIRHTPYVVVRFGADGKPQGTAGQKADLTPAQLHHEILGAIGSGRF